MTITLPIPHKDLSPNARPCWQAKARHTEKARFDAKMAAIDAMNKLGYPRPPMWNGVIAKATFYFRTKGRRDQTNLQMWAKAYEDGLTDAGVWRDDDTTVVTWLKPVVAYDKSDPRLEIEIEEIRD